MTVLSGWLGARLLASMVGSTPVPTPLVVVVDAAVVDGDVLAARLVAGLEPLVPILPLMPAAASVRVVGELLDFRVGLALATDGRRTWSWCPCTHAELVAHVQRRLAHALRSRSECPLPALRAIAPPSASRPPQLHGRAHERPRGRHGRLGVVLVGMGGLGLGTGLGVLAAAESITDDRWMPHSELRPAGIAAMAVGAIVLATGSLLLFLDHRSPRARLRALHP